MGHMCPLPQNLAQGPGVCWNRGQSHLIYTARFESPAQIQWQFAAYAPIELFNLPKAFVPTVSLDSCGSHI